MPPSANFRDDSATTRWRVTPPILERRQPGALAELSRKGALVTEAKLLGNFRDIFRSTRELVTGALDSRVDPKVLGRHAEHFMKFPIQVSLRQSSCSGEMLQIDRFTEVDLDVFRSLAHTGTLEPRAEIITMRLQRAHDADDTTLAIENGHFVGGDPIKSPARRGQHLHDIEQRLTRFEDVMIIDGKFVGNQLGVKFVVRVADHFTGALQAQSFGKLLADGDVTAEVILDKKMNAVQSVHQLQQLPCVTQAAEKLPLDLFARLLLRA